VHDRSLEDSCFSGVSVEKESELFAAYQLALILGGEDFLEDSAYLFDFFHLTPAHVGILFDIGGKVKAISRSFVEDVREELTEEELCLIEKPKVLLEFCITRFVREGGEEGVEVCVEETKIFVHLAGEIDTVDIEFEGTDVEPDKLIEIEDIVVEMDPLSHVLSIGIVRPTLDIDQGGMVEFSSLFIRRYGGSFTSIRREHENVRTHYYRGNRRG
jgi:hypothetical protein